MADSPPLYGYILGSAKLIGLKATMDLPPEAWWVPALVLFILAAAAAVDAIRATIPDPLIFLGLVAITGLQGLYVSWPFAAQHLQLALIAGIGLWAINQLWYLTFKRDALGMGDAKWTMLAVACFGFMPVVFAWGFGACLAVLWMGFMRISGYRITRVYFAPFLFIGLLAGIYWLRLRG